MSSAADTQPSTALAIVSVTSHPAANDTPLVIDATYTGQTRVPRADDLASGFVTTVRPPRLAPRARGRLRFCGL